MVASWQTYRDAILLNTGMLKLLLLSALIVLYCFSSVAVAQEYNYWVGGPTHLNFEQEPPQFNYFYNPDNLDGNSSICNNQGKLMFYIKNLSNKTDSVYNWKNHSIGSLYKGSWAWEHVFLRLNDSIYYLFYNGQDTPKTKFIDTTFRKIGLYYTVINANLNGGEGGIIGGNDGKDLLPASVYHTIGIAATQNEDSTWWVITRAGDNLFAIKVNSAGLSLPIISPAKETNYLRTPRAGMLETFKFSNDGNLLAVLSRYDTHSYTTDTVEEHYFTLYDFNKQTGRFSNQRVLKKNNIFSFSPIKLTWVIFNSITFSPNDSFLYLLQYDTTATNDNPISKITQYERFTTNILSSGVEIFSTQNWENLYRTLELGQNGRIIVTPEQADAGYYAYIYRPNKKGTACQLIHKALPVECWNTPTWKRDCPTFAFPFTRFHGNKMDFSHKTQCDSTIQMVNLCDKTKFTGYKWYIYGTDGNPYEDSAFLNEPVFKLPKEGRYWIKLRGVTHSGYEPWYSDTIEFKFLPVPTAKFSALTNKGCKYVEFNLADSTINGGNVNVITGQTWHWSFGDGKDSIINLPETQSLSNFYYVYNQSGEYIIKLTYTNGYCSDSFTLRNTIKIYDAPQPGISASATSGCSPATINVKRSYSDTITQITYNSGDGNVDISPTIINFTDGPAQVIYNKPGNYWLKQLLTGPTGCATKDSIQINVFAGFEQGRQPLLKYATIEDNNKVLIEWDSFSNTKEYILLRSSDNKFTWKNISTTKDITTNQFIDTQVSVKNTHYYYKITAVDTCGNIVESGLASTLLLSGITQGNDFAVIEWTPYEEWVSGIKGYSIEYEDSLNSWKSINSTVVHNYTDVSFGNSYGTEKCYRVIANAYDGYTSTSNTLCLPFSPVVWIPTAFTPNNDLLNDAFSITSLGIKEIKITIYNSYGEKIYNCSGLNCIWDGTFKNNPCSEGIYIYQVSARTNEDRVINYQGNITLIR